MRKMTTQEAVLAADELRDALLNAKATLREIQDYWRDDPELFRICAYNLGDFENGMNSVSSELDALVKQAAEEEAKENARHR